MPKSQIISASITDGTIVNTDIADSTLTTTKLATPNLGRRNLIINGDFQCWQRGTSATNAANNFLADRFRTNENTGGTWTVEQSSDHPTGTGFSLKSQVTGADTSIGSGEYAYLHQNIEAQNLQGLNYGTSNAKDFTLSFWVKSNKTGTYCIVVRKFDNTTYHLVHEFSINSANTWEKKIITITPTAGSTSLITASGGAFDNNNGNGFQIGWILCMGSLLNGGTNNTWTATTSHYSTTNQVNWMDSTDNNFYLAQVQLEIGSVASPFEHRSFAEELALCQRYFFQIDGTGTDYACMGAGQMYNATTYLGHFKTPVPMRTTPAFSLNNSLSTTNFCVVTANAVRAISSLTPTGDNQYIRISAAVTTSGTMGHGAYIQLQSGYNALWSAEL